MNTESSAAASDRWIRDSVAHTYADAEGPKDGLRIAGYGADDVGALPDGAAGEFLGCGNPLAFAEVHAGHTVLDLGSGAGIDLILAAERVGPGGRVIGIDMTDAMIERARRNVGNAGLTNVDIRQGIIEDLPVETGSVDWVISNCVVSLSPDKDRVFTEIARVLRPGGRMLISDIVVDEPLSAILQRMTRFAPSIAGARSEHDYLRRMEQAGLVDAAVRSRFVYEPEHLLAMFGGTTMDHELARSCPVAAAGAGATRAARAVKRSALSVAARCAAGHVWSAKFHGRRSADEP